MHSVLSLSVFALAMMQSLAAAAPRFQPSVLNNSTTSFSSSKTLPSSTLIGTGIVSTHPNRSRSTPIGTGIASTHPNPSSPTPIGTGFYSTTSTYPTANTTAVPPPHHTGVTTITSVVTNTKTLTWTVYVPCTTVVYGSTSYYSTASAYTTWVTDYQTLTFTESELEPTSSGVYAPPVVSAGTTTSAVGPVHATTTTTVLGYSNTAATCPPAATVTVSFVETVTVGAGYTVTVGAGQTITVTEASNGITVTSAPSTTTSSSTAEHGMCKPGTPCYSQVHGAWNSTLTSRHRTSGPAGTGTAIYPNHY